jgi:hypothetical protein
MRQVAAHRELPTRITAQAKQQSLQEGIAQFYDQVRDR